MNDDDDIDVYDIIDSISKNNFTQSELSTLQKAIVIHLHKIRNLNPSSKISSHRNMMKNLCKELHDLYDLILDQSDSDVANAALVDFEDVGNTLVNHYDDKIDSSSDMFSSNVKEEFDNIIDFVVDAQNSNRTTTLRSVGHKMIDDFCELISN